MEAYSGEFLGTMILVFLGNSVVANVVLHGTKGNGSGWPVIALGWMVAVMVPVMMFGAKSGAHFNPAVTLGLAMPIGIIPGFLWLVRCQAVLRQAWPEWQCLCRIVSLH